MSMFHELMMKKKGMPKNYELVDYIESTGTQWINTGVAKDLTHKYRFKGKVNFQDVTTRQLMGASGYSYFGVTAGYYQIAQGGGTHTPYQAPLNTDIDFDVSFDFATGLYSYIFNEISGQDTNSYFTGTDNFYLFNLNSLAFPCKCKLYGFELYDNNRLVRNFIPVYDTLTQKYGMWESVQGKFYGNDGTGDFKGSIVGYTVVGSPTIVDGVVSGFSSANYLLLGANVPYSNNFELFFKITTGTIGTNQAIFDWSGSNTGLTLIIYPNTGKLFMSAGNGNSWIIDRAGTTALSPNTTYYIKFSYKNNVYKLELSTDNINWNTEISVESSSTLVSASTKSMGYSTRFSGRVFSGSIDMNETYIKINNKLWFNGQQA